MFFSCNTLPKNVGYVKTVTIRNHKSLQIRENTLMKNDAINFSQSLWQQTLHK